MINQCIEKKKAWEACCCNNNKNNFKYIFIF